LPKNIIPFLSTDQLESVRSRLYSRSIRVASGCLEWQGATPGGRYGMIGAGRRNGRMEMFQTHRIAYALAYGDPGELCVCHHCDNPKCIDPLHLFLGTHKDNMQDMSIKGRSGKGSGRPIGSDGLKGEDSPVSKLTDDQVIMIFYDKRIQREIASEFKVHQSLVSLIKNKKLWRHILMDL